MKEYQNKDTLLPKYGDEYHHSRNAAIGAGKLQDGSQPGLHCEISLELNTLAFSHMNNCRNFYLINLSITVIDFFQQSILCLF